MSNLSNSRNSLIFRDYVNNLDLLDDIGFFEFKTNASKNLLNKISKTMFDILICEITKNIGNSFSEKNQLINHPSNGNFRLFEECKKRCNNFNFLFEKSNEMNELRSIITFSINRYFDKFIKNYRGNRPNYIHSWPLMLNNHIAKKPHYHHSNPFNICGVFYVDGEFKANNGELRIYPESKNSRNYITHIPKSGTLILFPANLRHEIGNLVSECTEKMRYSIAFDLWFKPSPDRLFLPLF